MFMTLKILGVILDAILPHPVSLHPTHAAATTACGNGIQFASVHKILSILTVEPIGTTNFSRKLEFSEVSDVGRSYIELNRNPKLNYYYYHYYSI